MTDPKADRTVDEHNHNRTLQARARELFKEGCLQGDVAREEVTELSDADVDMLTAISETAFTLGHKFKCDC